MQFFPRHGHCTACIQVCDSARDLGIPRIFNRTHVLERVRFVRTSQRIEQRIGQRRTLLSRERKRTFQKI